MLIDSSEFLERIPPDARRLMVSVVDHWKEAAEKRGSMPTRQDMGPARLRGLAQHVSLFDYDGQSRLIFRLASRHSASRMRQPAVGFNGLDVLSPTLRPIIERRLQLTARQPCAYAPAYLLQDTAGNHQLSITNMLPLAGEEPNVAVHYMRLEYMGVMIDWQPGGRDEVFIDKAGSFGTAFDLGHGLPEEFLAEMRHAEEMLDAWDEGSA